MNVNGTDDHVHLLVKLTQNHTPKDVLREIKANTSGWIHRTYPALADFAWQAGYGALTMSASQKKRVCRNRRRATKYGRSNRNMSLC